MTPKGSSKKRNVFRNPLRPDEYIIFDPNGARTVVRDDDSFGLVIRQKLPHGPAAHIRYGNDQQGYELYIQLLKYLIATHQRVPPFVKSSREVHRSHTNVDSRVEYEILQPYPARHEMDMNSTATYFPGIWGNQQHGLVFRQDEQFPLFLSSELIGTLVPVMHRIYAHNSVFREINTHMRQPSTRRRIGALHFIPVSRGLYPTTHPTRMRSSPREVMQRIRDRARKKSTLKTHRR